MHKIAVLIDGGYLRVLVRKRGINYDPNYIEKVGLACSTSDESIFRILYYDCAPYSGTVKLPVSGAEYTFSGSDHWLKDLAKRDLFAVRKGVLKFRGYKPKRIPVVPGTLKDADFTPDFEQKGVDMRIGLDLAVYAQTRVVDRIVLVTGDTDCIPAMKHGRKSGLQVAIVKFPQANISNELAAHADFVRAIPWPTA